MALREYLYIDHRRLDSYLEQIAPPVTYDKVPIWHAEIGLTGPKAEATQERRGRTLTQHEKVEALLEHLTSSELVYDARPPASHSRHGAVRPFVLETCSAVRFEVPVTVLPDYSARKLFLWISLPNPRGPERSRAKAPLPGILCLLEDFWCSDKAPHNCYEQSSFGLLCSIRGTLDNPATDFMFRNESTREESGEVRLSWDGSAHQMTNLAKNLLALLKSWGCIPGPLRNIRTLYRIREYGVEDWVYSDGRPGAFSIFGYPIVIWDRTY